LPGLGTPRTNAVLANTTISAQEDSAVMIESTDSAKSVLIAWVLQKMSPLTEFFDTFILKTLASGVYEKWKKEDRRLIKREDAQWLQENRHSQVNQRILKIHTEYTQFPVQPPSTKNIMGSIGMAIIGISISVVLFALEIALNMRSRLSTRRNLNIY